MKSILLTIVLSLTQFASVSLLRIETVTKALYLHGSDDDPRISFQAVPYITHASEQEWRIPAISAPFILATSGSWKRHDINLASLYGITVDGPFKTASKDILVTLDASKTTQPPGYPFRIEQVNDAIATCVKIMYPQRRPSEGALELAFILPSKEAHPSK